MTLVRAGHWYVETPGGLIEVEVWDENPQRWAVVTSGAAVVACRRVADFPVNRPLPAPAAIAACDRCQAPVVVGPSSPAGPPRRCLQCAGITPLPL
jgi:hypothetical protein